MNCKNCGAAMVLSGTQSYSQCLHCGSYYFPERQDEGVKVVGGPSQAHKCPECRKLLSPATLDDHSRVLYCTNCRGVLLPRSVFATVVQTRRAWTTAPPAAPLPLERAALERKALCPACSREMTTHPYHGPGNIVIDTCEGCDVIWLGTGELSRAVDAPGRDRGNALRGGQGAADYGLKKDSAEGDDDDDHRHMIGAGRRIDLLALIKDLM
jgi:Zn-finger nucleic acid-binding protein